jgi:hypothetical protein
VNSGVHGAEREAHGRFTPENDLKGEIPMRSRKNHRNSVRHAYFLNKFAMLWFRVGSSPTGRW